MKKTQPAKDRLNAHIDMLEKLEALEVELQYAYGSIRGSNITGMPGGGGFKGTSETEAIARRKIELEKMVSKQKAEIDRDWAELEPMVEDLRPIETLIINLRYRYGGEWDEVCRAVFGRREDYELELDRYMNKMFKAHGRALLELAEMIEKKA